jgi:release factor glutamine methyltransferase
MNLKQVLQEATIKLESAKITSARLDAEVILCFVLKKSKEFLYTNPEQRINQENAYKFNTLIEKRATHYPIAYLVKQKSFYNLDFFVNEMVLIPRPETEQLVEVAAKGIKQLINQSNKQPTIVDIGTGSGCIAITLAKQFPKSKFIATDVSPAPIAIAKKNATKHKVDISFLKGNLYAPLEGRKIDLVIANLPYLDDDMENLLQSSDSKALKFEPELALKGGEDGLDYYRKLLEEISKAEHKPKSILLEIGHKQADPLRQFISTVLPDAQVEIIKDLKQRNRVVKISI